MQCPLLASMRSLGWFGANDWHKGRKPQSIAALASIMKMNKYDRNLSVTGEA